MKFSEIIELMEGDTQIVVDVNGELYPYKVDDVMEDFIFYDSIRDQEIERLWYSVVYKAMVIILQKPCKMITEKEVLDNVENYLYNCRMEGHYIPDFIEVMEHVKREFDGLTTIGIDVVYRLYKAGQIK